MCRFCLLPRCCQGPKSKLVPATDITLTSITLIVSYCASHPIAVKFTVERRAAPIGAVAMTRNTATTTSLEKSSDNVKVTRRGASPPSSAPEALRESTTKGDKKPSFRTKYRHVAAVHSKTRPSCLSHDAVLAPSFLGFRNLMVIVLSEWLLHGVPECETTAD